jgi:hypothetical protein
MSDRLVAPSRPGWRRTTETSDLDSRTNGRINHDHRIRIQDSKILYIKSGYIDRLSDRRLSINWDDNLTLSGSWKSLIRSLKKGKTPASRPPWLMCSRSSGGPIHFLPFPPLKSNLMLWSYANPELPSSDVSPSGVTPSFLLLFLFVSAALRRPILFLFLSLSSYTDVIPSLLLFPVFRMLSHVLYTVLHFNPLFFRRSTFLRLFSIAQSSGVTLAPPLRRFCYFSHILVAYSRTSTKSLHCLEVALSLLPFPPTVQATLLPLVFFISPSIDSDVFPYRRHFSYFRYYSGVIPAYFLFPHAATWMARWLSLRTSHRLQHHLYTLNYASTCFQYYSWTVWSLKKGPTDCSESLVKTYQHRQRKNTQERRPLSICFTSYFKLMKPAV